MLGLIFSGSLYVTVIVGKQFTVWMLFCRSVFNKMLNIKPMISFWYIVMPSYKIRPFLSDRWCFFLCWEGGNSTSAIYPYFRPFSYRRNYIPQQHTNTTYWISNGYPSFVKQYRWILRNNYIFSVFTCAYRKLTCWTFFSNHVTPV